MNITQEQLETMLTAQNELNEKYTGKNWRNDFPSQHFVVAVITETAELFESAPRMGVTGSVGWKSWRLNLENDEQNIRVEAIDVVHFTLSLMLQKASISDILNISIDDDLELSSDPFASFLSVYASFIKSALSNDVNDILVNGLVMIHRLEQMVAEDDTFIYEGYFKKNKLNQTRIASGYITGDYDKMASGEEDNKMLKV